MIDSLEECFLLTNAPAQLTFTLSVSLLQFSLLLANFADKKRKVLGSQQNNTGCPFFAQTEIDVTMTKTG